jgi:hypothetical protein
LLHLLVAVVGGGELFRGRNLRFIKHYTKLYFRSKKELSTSLLEHALVDGRKVAHSSKRDIFDSERGFDDG